jgi:hypothetical protein
VSPGDGEGRPRHRPAVSPNTISTDNGTDRAARLLALRVGLAQARADRDIEAEARLCREIDDEYVADSFRRADDPVVRKLRAWAA